MNRLAKRVAGIIAIVVVLVAIVYGSWYSYILTKAIFTYQCKIYDGSGFDAEQKEICANYNSGGLRKVLTN